MPNMSLKKVAMPVQDPEVRCHNFEEVTTGYTEEMEDRTPLYIQ